MLVKIIDAGVFAVVVVVIINAAGAGGSSGNTPNDKYPTRNKETVAAVEATAVAGGVDTGSATTVTTATMVTAMTMSRSNDCDASTEEKERPSNPSRMHATIK